MFGLAELVIIGAVIVAAVLFFFMRGAAQNNAGKAKVESVYHRVEPTDIATRIDWNAIADESLQSYLPNHKINAIKRYRELTGVGLKDGKDAVEYAIDHPEAMKKGKAHNAVIDTDGAGVRDLIAEGRMEEAVDVYAAFMGVDKFTAKDAVYNMQREFSAERNLSFYEVEAEARQLLAEGKKIQAIKLYREMTNLGLKEAKDAVDRMEREDT